MPAIVYSGTATVSVRSSAFGITTIKCAGLQSTDQIVATSRPTHGGNPPVNGADRLGPLFVPFVDRKISGEPHIPEKPSPDPGNFDILVYDIMANAFSVDVIVDWAVIR